MTKKLIQKLRSSCPIIAAAFVTGTVSEVTAQQSSPPNVVMIMIDDMGWSDIAAYRRYQGHDFIPIETPNIDRLVEGGMMFTDAHTAAVVCAPTRFAMMTGSNPPRNGVFRGTWLIEAESGLTIDRKHTTVGEVAQAGGYRTAMIGKMHLGGGLGSVTVENVLQNPVPAFPQSFGFDYSLVTHNGIQAEPNMFFENGRYKRTNPNNPSDLDQLGTADDLQLFTGIERGETREVPNGKGNVRNGLNDPNLVESQNGIINTDHVVWFIEDHVENHSDQPFMLYYCPPQMHRPHSPPVDFAPDPVTGAPASPPNIPIRGTTEYQGTEAIEIVAEIDQHVAKILAALEDPDGDPSTDDSVLADTLILFTSDNGGIIRNLKTDSSVEDEDAVAYRSPGVLRGRKGEQYEGGHRVPFIAHWGDGTRKGSTITPGVVNDALIGAHDWVATMYALTGQEIPEDQAMDSVNILPVLLQQKTEVRDYILLQAQQRRIDRPNSPFDPNPYIIRMGDYVLNMSSILSNGEAGHDENLTADLLFNLRTDLTQETNLLDPANHEGGVVPAEITALAQDMLELYKTNNEAHDVRYTPLDTGEASGEPFALFVEHDGDYSAADLVADGVSVTLSGNPTGANGTAGSNDGAAGALAFDVDAPTEPGCHYVRLGETYGSGMVSILIENTSGQPLDLEGLHFDYGRLQGGGARNLEIRYFAHGSATGEVVANFSGFPRLDRTNFHQDFPDFDVQLDGLLSNQRILPGETGTFVLQFSNARNGRTIGCLDNLSVTATSPASPWLFTETNGNSAEVDQVNRNLEVSISGGIHRGLFGSTDGSIGYVEESAPTERGAYGVRATQELAITLSNTSENVISLDALHFDFARTHRTAPRAVEVYVDSEGGTEQLDTFTSGLPIQTRSGDYCDVAVNLGKGLENSFLEPGESITIRISPTDAIRATTLSGIDNIGVLGSVIAAE